MMTTPAAARPRSWVCRHCAAPLDVHFDHVGECPPAPGGGPFDCSGTFGHPRNKGRSNCLLEAMTIGHDDARDANADVCGAPFHAVVNDNLLPARCALPRGHDGVHRTDYNGIGEAVVACWAPASVEVVAEVVDLLARASDLVHEAPGAYGDQVRGLIGRAMRRLGAQDAPGSEDGPSGGRYTRRAQS